MTLLLPPRSSALMNCTGRGAFQGCSRLSRRSPLGYGALGLDLAAGQSGELWAWADGQADQPPLLAQPSGGGRGSLEMLGLKGSVRGAGWFCVRRHA